jgi:hypothetical protein
VLNHLQPLCSSDFSQFLGSEKQFSTEIKWIFFSNESRWLTEAEIAGF